MVPIGIEKPTVIERFISLIPLPYPLAALIWSAILPTGSAFLFIQYLATGTLPLSTLNLLSTFLTFLLPFYLFLMVRYMG